MDEAQEQTGRIGTASAHGSFKQMRVEPSTETQRGCDESIELAFVLIV